jgi:hypothetical protein
MGGHARSEALVRAGTPPGKDGSVSGFGLVYGIVNENLVLLPEDVAQAVAEDLEAIGQFTTYGEARRFEPLYLGVPGLDDDDFEEVAADGDLYVVTATNEYQNGDWPPPVATVALENLPDDIQDIGEEVERFPSSPTLYIDPTSESHLLEDLRQRGYSVRRDDGLIQRIGSYA